MRIYVLVLLLILTFSNPAYASKDWDRSIDFGQMRGLDNVSGSGGGGFGPDEPWDDAVVGGNILGRTQTVAVQSLTVAQASIPTNPTVVKGSSDVQTSPTDQEDSPLVSALKDSGIIVGNGGSATASETGDSTGIFRETGTDTGIFERDVKIPLPGDKPVAETKPGDRPVGEGGFVEQRIGGQIDPIYTRPDGSEVHPDDPDYPKDAGKPKLPPAGQVTPGVTIYGGTQRLSSVPRAEPVGEGGFVEQRIGGQIDPIYTRPDGSEVHPDDPDYPKDADGASSDSDDVEYDPSEA